MDGAKGQADERPDALTDVLRGIVALEAQAAKETGAAARVRYVGDYELLSEIARGGMGVVFRARQSSLNREVALKMILGGPAADGEAVARFRSEAEAAARLRHPGIVPIYEVGIHAGQPYFSMELVEGESLEARLENGVLSARQAAEYVRAVAEAIHYAHGEGILHRDLKPSNILIDADDRPRVTDYGLAKEMEGDARTLTGQAMGTPSYMPPEQALGNPALIGPASDVYALGAVLYELVTGRPPFRASTPVLTLQQVLHHEAPSPSALNPNVPRDIAVICMKCLQKAPGKRYGDAQELADDLTRFLQRKPINARPTSPVARSLSWVRRNPWAVAGAGTAVLVTLAGLAYWLWVERSYWRLLAQEGVVPHRFGGRPSSVFGVDALFFICMILPWIGSDSRGLRRALERPWKSALIVLMGIFGILASIESAKGFIDRAVWSDTLALALIPQTYFFAYTGVFVLARVFRAYDGRVAGMPGEISIAQRDELFELLESGGKPGFRRRVAEAVDRFVELSGADRHYARIELKQMWRELYILHPDRVPNPRPVWKILVWGAFVLLMLGLMLDG